MIRICSRVVSRKALLLEHGRDAPSVRAACIDSEEIIGTADEVIYFEGRIHRWLFVFNGLRKEVRLYKEQLRDARVQTAKLMSDKKGVKCDINERKRTDLDNDLLKILKIYSTIKDC